jgi:hypothetical protein
MWRDKAIWWTLRKIISAHTSTEQVYKYSVLLYLNAIQSLGSILQSESQLEPDRTLAAYIL